MDDIALSVKNLHKHFKLPHERKSTLKEWVLHFRKPTYEKFHALKDINFEVKRGEFFGIVGRNGSGKSTLLKIIGGIYQPSKGSVIVNGTLTPFIELGIGFNPELTGRENVFLNGAILGLTRKEILAKYDEIVDFAELEQFMDQKLKNYSSGMQVRLAFSIAIQAHNDILLIDEVLAVGDTAFQKKCFDVFKSIKASGKTVIFVTHDMSAVQEFCDRAMMIQDSRVLMIDNPRDVALRYEVANASVANRSQGSMQRPKNPTVTINGIKVRSSTTKKETFALEETIYAEVTFEVHEQQQIQFNLYFVRSDGVYIAGVNTTEDLPGYAPGPGKHTILCKIDGRQLTKHTYRLNAAVYTLEEPPKLLDIYDASYGVDTPNVTILEKSDTQDGEFYIRAKWSKVKGVK